MSVSGSGQDSEERRQYRVIDQMLTMHALYRDFLNRRAFWLNTILVALSLFLSVFSFVSDGLLAILGYEPEAARFIFGVAAVAVLIGAITEYRVDWKSVAGGHAEAARKLATTKALYRERMKKVRDVGGAGRSLSEEYNAVMEALPVIPDRWFNALKARHCYKVVLSQRISQYPKTPIWLLRFQVRKEGIREALRPE